MAITSTQSQQPASSFNFTVGSYLDTGTVAAFTITLGYRPRYVKVVNTNGSGYVMVEWFEGMADAYGVLTASNGDRSTITSNGITPLSYGFTVGLNTDLCYTSEQLEWLALG